jgi:hypothetical protein
MQFLLEMSATAPKGETIWPPATCYCDTNSDGKEAERAMMSRITDDSEPLDRKTLRSICDAVGERLQQSLRPDALRPSSHLEHLMDELRKRDSQDRFGSH